MTARTVYQYDATTGHINMSISGDWADNNPWLFASNHLVVSAPIPATTTLATTNADGTITNQSYGENVSSGWSFTLGPDGKPSRDTAGNYLVTPSPDQISPPDASVYNFAALVKTGAIDLTQVHGDLVVTMNYSLASVGAPPIPGTSHLPPPVKTAVTDCSSIEVFTPPAG